MRSPPWGGIPRNFWVFIQDEIQDKKMQELQHFLQSEYDFPEISYFIIFYLQNPYAIHVDWDGETGGNATSLNLQLKGYMGSKMEFFEPKKNKLGYIPVGIFSNLWLREDVDKVAELDLTPNWTLINTAKPHSVIVGNSNDPKICLAVRFKGCPSFEESLSKLQRIAD